MDRLACVDIPALPLQILLGSHPEWGDAPAAVVDKDKPLGMILWVNERGRRAGVLPGLRYAAGLGLASGLRAGEVPESAIAAEVDAIAALLRMFSPDVEPSADEPGVFFLDARGLGGLYPSLDEWAAKLWRALADKQRAAGVAVGFRRFGVYAAARSFGGARTMVFTSGTEEAKFAHRVPLTRVALPPDAQFALARLGVHTVGDFVRLPAAGLLRRFGREAHRLHRLASGDLAPPLCPTAPTEPLVQRVHLDDPESDTESLMFRAKQLLDPLLGKLAKRGQALAELSVRLELHRAGEVRERIRPAEPTLDAGQLLGLLRLRLESLTLQAGADTVEVEAVGAPASKDQLRLFSEKARRDPAAAARAFARLRASFGDDAVVRAAPAEGHLPEASYVWEPMTALAAAAPREQAEPRPLVRRVQARPTPLPPRPRQEPDGWLLRGLEHGPVTRMVGPYLLSGGWWRAEIERDYYFAEMRSGALLWVYYDRRRRRWFLHGSV